MIKKYKNYNCINFKYKKNYSKNVTSKLLYLYKLNIITWQQFQNAKNKYFKMQIKKNNLLDII